MDNNVEFSQCPVCHTRFKQPATGRKRVYCKRSCKDKQFRRARSASKLTDSERSALIERHMFTGDWRVLDSWPTWPQYKCLACGAAIGPTTPAWYNFNDWDQINGVYRRHICTQCHPAETQTN
ncbi:MAG: hypothetical protein KDJ65_01550 [Anaerolineae bacterium]|nr:hypothetical protein [Anaerolineae bacterium]